MKNTLFAIATLWSVFASASPLTADCGKRLPIKTALSHSRIGSGNEGGNGFAPFIIGDWPLLGPDGNPDQKGGTVLFVKSSSEWAAFIIQEYEVMEQILRGPKHHLTIITSTQIEGPPSSYTIYNANAALKQESCAVINVPAEVEDALAELQIRQMGINPNGVGKLIASWDPAETPTIKGTRWYEYSTRDGGRTWGRPRRTAGAENLNNAYASFKLVAVPQLEKELRAYAAHH